ncbi:MAG: hypothetical protein GY817_00990 [bacterium]|nr:hypothetical protein [bacterium]
MKKMKDVKYEVKGQEFIIEDYNNAKSFASFFPAIAGEFGKPMWCYYVNRGQAISCFGTKDKDGAIIEFSAANKAYRQTPTQGFRTFYKVDGQYYEPFKNAPAKKSIQRMHITSYVVKIVDINEDLGIETTVEYFTLPNEVFPALMRKLSIKNISTSNKNIKCLEGLPIIIPYGTMDFLLKNISRLAEGWYNGVFFSDEQKVPVYKLPVEPQDRPEVVPVYGGNFYVGYYEKDGQKVFPEFIVDPDNIFGEVRNFEYADKFIADEDFGFNPHLTGKNKTPSGMGHFEVELESGKTFVYNSTVGHAHNAKDIDKFIKIFMQDDYINQKEEENKKIINQITGDVLTKSSLQKFDNYCEQNFIDNLLRGGYPVSIGEGESKTTYYVYSRIHGDMEREYNNFMILPEYYSQGNGNYRDVNQNRRSDIFFNQHLKDSILVEFMNLIQLDGFNPLKVLGVTFDVVNKESFIASILGLTTNQKKLLLEYLSKPITIGSLYNFIENHHMDICNKEVLVSLIKNSEKVTNAEHSEGYWSDHWHYNIDLIESFLSIFPDKIDDLFLNNTNYTFYDDSHSVTPRTEKHVIFLDEPRQLNGVINHEEKEELIQSRLTHKNVVRKAFGKGEVYQTNLLNKLFSLLANKYASLDPEGVGVEMETDKPNWCDALNGLPGTFGSSTAESFELKRLLLTIKNALDNIAVLKVNVMEESMDLLHKLENITIRNLNNFDFWDETHTAKEKYREQTLYGISGGEVAVKVSDLKKIADVFLVKVNEGLNKALDNKSGVVFTNIEYIATKHEPLTGKVNSNGNQCIKITAFERKDLPLFLEGPVHYLRLGPNIHEADKLHKNLMNSALYDKKLKMIKVNAPLDGVELATGRIKIFTPGWLENESIWTHMEYKYLLELLRNGMSKSFFDLAHTALVPFMDPEKYGRSIFENSSFVVSSAHPEPEIHGQGFVSRLSGSTAEFISIWLAMTSGLKPFTMQKEELVLEFKPQVSADLFTKEKSVIELYSKCEKCVINHVEIPANSFAFKFLSKTLVVYRNDNLKNSYDAKIEGYKLTLDDGEIIEIFGNKIIAEYAFKVRNGEVSRIDVSLI